MRKGGKFGLLRQIERIGLQGLGAALLAGLVLSFFAGSSLTAAESKRLVVVELFTSQGCNSCPPADAFLGELAQRDDVIPLSLHIDYWDYIGWRDPFASPAMTERQRAYADALSLRYVYTPQVIVQGRFDIAGNRRDEILAAIEEAKAVPPGLSIEIVREGMEKVKLSAGHAPPEGATIWLAIFDRKHETEVSRGENAGKLLKDYNVVRIFERLGTWTGEAMEIPVDLKAAGVSGHDRCAIIVQEGRNGPVLAAAAIDIPQQP
jgi:hypothetical protein